MGHRLVLQATTTPEKFHDGWLRTGDVGTLDDQGYMQITDRTKDVIKSGGEWISSVELENEVMAHPDVFEAAVIAVPDPGGRSGRWWRGARARAELAAPRTCGVPDGRVARWWLPERWTFLEEVPKTSVGKFDKKVLRASSPTGGDYGRDRALARVSARRRLGRVAERLGESPRSSRHGHRRAAAAQSGDPDSAEPGEALALEPASSGRGAIEKAASVLAPTRAGFDEEPQIELGACFRAPKQSLIHRYAPVGGIGGGLGGGT